MKRREFSVTVDNWTFQSALASMNDCDEYNALPNQEYVHFLEAIVLWDNIRYINNGFSFSWSSHADLYSIQDMILELEISDYDMIEKSAQSFLSQNNFPTNIVSQGAITYAMIGQTYGVDILLTDKRADFLSQMPTSALLTRKNILNAIDTDLQKFYSELYDKIGYQPFRFRFPVLIDYLRMLNGSNKNLLKTAKELHDNEDVVLLRSALNDLEMQFTNRNLSTTLLLLKQIPNITQSLFSDKGVKDFGELSISVPFSLSYSKSLNFNERKKDPSFIFLKTLVNYGTSDRLMNMRL